MSPIWAKCGELIFIADSFEEFIAQGRRACRENIRIYRAETQGPQRGEFFYYEDKEEKLLLSVSKKILLEMPPAR
jgi:hypothetical protein